MSENLPQIGILGAGIAGLVAGLELQRTGFAVSVFEARTRTGGRIQSFRLDQMIIESGPEFIHGKLRETLKLLDKYHIGYVPVNGKMYSARHGEIRETYDMAAGWNGLIEKMQGLNQDMPFREFLDMHFPGEENNELKNSAVRYAEGFDLADVQRAGTRALVKEWEHEESEQFRIPTGYSTLTDAIEKEFKSLGGKILLDNRIKTIDWNEERIIIKSNQLHAVDKLIVSLPLSLLNKTALPQESILFSPSLTEKSAAFNEIGFGSVVKIVMIWDSSFWTSLIPDGQFIFSDAFIPTWWTQYPLDLPMLTGWFGGPKADAHAGNPDSFFLEKAIESLSAIFSVSEEKIKSGLKASRIFNWKNEPWTRGAYSYSLVGSERAKAVCREPVENRIYFTGEAYYEGPFPGTVEAAVTSGLDTAARLLQDNDRLH